MLVVRAMQRIGNAAFRLFFSVPSNTDGSAWQADAAFCSPYVSALSLFS
jgi:hypothetical protein